MQIVATHESIVSLDADALVMGVYNEGRPAGAEQLPPETVVSVLNLTGRAINVDAEWMEYYGASSAR